MANLTDEIASVLREEIIRYESGIDVRQVGRVLEVGDGIARVWGLSGVMAGEMVEFPGDITGLAFNLEENSVGVIILGDYLKVTEGDEVKSTGRLLSVPVGDAVIGRVLAGMPASVHGKVILTFRDWANDPRELCEIAEVIDFCNGLIYGHEPMSNPDPAHPVMARSVLPVLLDESTFGDQPVWDAVGRNWIVSVAHASVCFTQRNGRWLSDVGLADNLIRVFLGVEG